MRGRGREVFEILRSVHSAAQQSINRELSRGTAHAHEEPSLQENRITPCRTTPCVMSVLKIQYSMYPVKVSLREGVQLDQWTLKIFVDQ